MDAFPALRGSMGMVTPAPEVLALRAGSGEPRALDKVATGFESVFLSMLLKEMRQTLEPDTLFPEDQADVLGGLFDTFLSQHLAQYGAFGIAALVKRQLAAKTPTP